MRITGGSLKSRPIPTQFSSHVRPSTDRVRESLFSFLAIHKGIDGASILDAFSGSGIIGLEFISRDASQVMSIDIDRKNTKHQLVICQTWDIKNWRIVEGNAIATPAILKKNGLSIPAFDIIFADPPYDMPNIQALYDIYMPLLFVGGWLIIEHKPQLIFPQLPHLKKEYGSTSMTIFARE